MKKIFFLTIILIGISFQSCKEDFEDLVNSPNSPTVVPPSSLLSTAEVTTFFVHSGTLTRISSIFTQQLTGTADGQFGAMNLYNINESAYENDWDVLYTNALTNTKIIIDDFGADNPHYKGMAQVLMAINLAILTDFWGDVPFSDALDALNGSFSPTFDKQTDVYGSVQNLLTNAIDNLEQPASANALTPGADDLIYGGDVEKWKAAAYLLKARYYLRLSETGGTTLADAMTALDKSQFTDASFDMPVLYDGGSTSTNQYFAFEVQRANYLVLNKFFVDLMKNADDPRLPFYALPDVNNEFTGTDKDDIVTTTVSHIGPYIASPAATRFIISYEEAKFIEAELKMRNSDQQGAEDALRAAMEASLTKVTGTTDNSFIDGIVNGATLETIMDQKYIALFTYMEPYHDYRRTGFPQITPVTGFAEIPLRIPVPTSERNTNPNTPASPGLFAPVWWDQ